MLSVIRRELRSYFCTPVGYVFVGIFWVLGAAFFFLYNILAATSDMNALFGNLSYLFMLIVPLLTMRLLSEEKKLKTDQLFCCMPTPLGAIVTGKYLAALLVLLLALAGTLLYIDVLAQYAVLQVGMLASCYLGFFLLCSVYIAIGLLMSALTESQVTAAVLTLAVNMLLQLAEMAAPSVHVPYLPWLPSLLQAISLNSHFSRFTTGVFTPLDVGYFLLWAAMLLILTTGCCRAQRMRRK